MESFGESHTNSRYATPLRTIQAYVADEFDMDLEALQPLEALDLARSFWEALEMLIERVGAWKAGGAPFDGIEYRAPHVLYNEPNSNKSMASRMESNLIILRKRGMIFYF